MMHVVWSPHFDDAALSLGGAIPYWRAQGDRVLVVVVCAAVPPPGLAETPFIRRLQHDRAAPDYVALRRREELDAMAILGCEHLWADALDAIYRVSAYGHEAALFAEPVPGDPLWTQVAAIAERLPKDARWYLPLSIGGQVDHRIVSAGVRHEDLRFYEDLPYGLVAGATETRVRERGVRPAERLPALLDKKLDAVAAYPSQLETLFGDEAKMRQVLAAHAHRLGGGAPVEQLFAEAT